MRRLYADKLVIITAVLIVLFSVLFALVQSRHELVDLSENNLKNDLAHRVSKPLEP